MAPAVGTFLRPVTTGPRLYCLRVDRTGTAESGLIWARATRYGLDENGQPHDDGRLSDGFCVTGLRQVVPGVWRVVPRFNGVDAIYYRAIRVANTQLATQQDLFA